MKVTREIDLDYFDAWSGGKETLDGLRKTGFVDNAQELVEELWPDGVDATTLNDFLWFELKDMRPEWFNGDWDEMQDAIRRIDSMPKPWFIADGGTPVVLEYTTDDDDARVFQIGANWMEDIDYDFSKSFEENLGMLKIYLDREHGIRERLPDGMEYVEDFPEWAVFYLIYGEDPSLSDEERKEIDGWMKDNGYARLVSDGEEYNRNPFDTNPAFGKACATRVVVMKREEDSNG